VSIGARAHQTFHDGLVKELRLRGICTIDDANRYLPELMDDYNRRFARAAQDSSAPFAIFRSG
jgi:hypothetical protein